ncbi:MAG TPA: SRPBCC family protein [Pseudonocardiaceae bacterium]|jgi:uncharacterized protein YndB with AHSA1/START domain|nr:SRPBCC family protein [Pseudonocardiaceae bacterium]
MTTQGTIEQHEGRVSFRYERLFNHPIETVWRAITDPEELAQWLGSKPELDLRVGGRYVMIHTSPDGSKEQRVEDRVVRLEPPRLFEHTFWLEVNPSALVTWELTPTGDGTRLDLTHALDRADLAAAATIGGGEDIVTVISRNAAGWHRLLDRITAQLDDVAQPWSRSAQQELQQRYASMVD